MIILSSTTTEADFSPEAIYAHWAEPAAWATWDPEVRAVDFAGPARVGATGRLRPTNGPTTRFTVTATQHGRIFTNSSKLPGTTLTFEHLVDSHPRGSEITVTVSLAGPLAPIWARLMGKGMAQAASSSVEGLLRHLAG